MTYFRAKNKVVSPLSIYPTGTGSGLLGDTYKWGEMSFVQCTSPIGSEKIKTLQIWYSLMLAFVSILNGNQTHLLWDLTSPVLTRTPACRMLKQVQWSNTETSEFPFKIINRLLRVRALKVNVTGLCNDHIFTQATQKCRHCTVK